MRNFENANDIENALIGLMPVPISLRAQSDIGEMLDQLVDESEQACTKPNKTVHWAVITGAAAALVLGAAAVLLNQTTEEITADISPSKTHDPEMVFLTETDRIEEVKDEGLYVDSGGSAVIKVRVRVVEESRMRDEETGIIVMFTEPREEMYMLPVSTF